MRGEYRKDGRIENLWPELPPHARRIRGVNPARRIIRGTTSACAENTEASHCLHEFHRNYLRMRGEYLMLVGSLWIRVELPPHARRIPGVLQDPRQRLGTTSACAENTATHKGLFIKLRNYLRMRGEYRYVAPPCAGPFELPPHARRIPAEN